MMMVVKKNNIMVVVVVKKKKKKKKTTFSRKSQRVTEQQNPVQHTIQHHVDVTRHFSQRHDVAPVWQHAHVHLVIAQPCEAINVFCCELNYLLAVIYMYVQQCDAKSCAPSV
jgi:hypothetical protein